MMKTEDLFEMFKFAIEREYEAYEYYKSISEESDDVVIKNIFAKMSQDEFEHRATIMELYKKAKEQSSGMST